MSIILGRRSMHPRRGKPGPPEERFWRFVERGAPDECWQWTGGTANGYGKFVEVWNESARQAHRFAYELLVGPIPEGLHLDHLCRNPGCVNPAHLEPVTMAENTRRGLRGRMVTHCPRGHEYTPENTAYNKRPQGNPGRYCKTCHRERQAARYWQMKAAR